MAEYLDMGGYGIWIWPSWGVSALVMIGLVLQSRYAAKKMAAEAERLKLLRRASRKRSSSEVNQSE